MGAIFGWPIQDRHQKSCDKGIGVDLVTVTLLSASANSSPYTHQAHGITDWQQAA